MRNRSSMNISINVEPSKYDINTFTVKTFALC